MLDQYLQRTRLLLTDADFSVFNEDDLTNYINMARGQLAAESDCIRVYGTLAVTAASQQYSFSTINLGGAAGVQGVLSVNQITYAVASGQKAMHSRPFAWFNQFILSQPVPTPGPPASWCQYGPGSLGSLFINLLDGAYTLSLDTECYPINLVDDTTVEAIPYTLTDAVPFFAAYFAALTTGNTDKAKAMFDEYQKFVGLGKIGDMPSVLPGNFSSGSDPFLANRLGLQQSGKQ